MPNAIIPRSTVHDWSETIGKNPLDHQTALSRLLREQRRLSKFIEENQESMSPGTGGVALYLVGVVIRMYELGGGRLRNVTWDDVRKASAKVEDAMDELLPADAGFPERLRKISWRAQPHILDEALMALYERPSRENEVDLANAEKVKVMFLLWVANEVLDANWAPPKSFAGDSTYAYVKIEPTE